MSDRPDGTYPGNVVNAYVAEDQWEKGQLVLKLDVNLEGGGVVTCRQPLGDDDKDKKAKRDSVLRALGIAWPFRSGDVRALSGKGIDVNLKTSAKGRQNAYVATQFEERVLTDDEIDARVGAENDVPF